MIHTSFWQQLTRVLGLIMVPQIVFLPLFHLLRFCVLAANLYCRTSFRLYPESSDQLPPYACIAYGSTCTVYLTYGHFLPRCIECRAI